MTMSINYYFHRIPTCKHDVYNFVFPQSAGKVKKSMVGWIAFIYRIIYIIYMIISSLLVAVVVVNVAGNGTKLPDVCNL